jgi:hypothetical protein
MYDFNLEKSYENSGTATHFPQILRIWRPLSYTCLVPRGTRIKHVCKYKLFLRMFH